MDDNALNRPLNEVAEPRLTCPQRRLRLALCGDIGKKRNGGGAALPLHSDGCGFYPQARAVLTNALPPTVNGAFFAA
jgi:hypothetical protein